MHPAENVSDHVGSPRYVVHFQVVGLEELNLPDLPWGRFGNIGNVLQAGVVSKHVDFRSM